MYYLDNAAIKKPDEKLFDFIFDILKNRWYNPNSIYDVGIDANSIIKKARNSISDAINCDQEEIIFCSCGSEANSLATCGYIRKYNQKYFITSTIEHSSIYDNPYAKKLITVDKYGFFNLEEIKKIKNSLVSLQIANSEIGTIQNMKTIVAILHENNCVVHVDAVAAFGKIKIDVKDLDVDMLTATSQKIGGILGASFLYKKRSVELEPLIFGHNTLRGGTPNVISIGCLAKAIELLDVKFKRQSLEYPDIYYVRNYMQNLLCEEIDDCIINGADIKHRLPNNINISFKGVEAESLLLMLNMDNIYVSSGSACNSGDTSPSYVLQAIKVPDEYIRGTIRITLPDDFAFEDADYVVGRIKGHVERLRKFGER